MNGLAASGEASQLRLPCRSFFRRKWRGLGPDKKMRNVGMAVSTESDCPLRQPRRTALPARTHRTMDAMRQVLLDILRAQAGESARGWLDKALAAAVAPVHANTLLGYHAGASRRMGKQVLKLTRHEAARLAETAPGVSFAEWGGDEFARAVLLLSLYSLDTETRRELIYQCYEKGDSREQESWLRILPLLPDGETFLDTAIDACRTNIVPVFEAIACENPNRVRSASTTLSHCRRSNDAHHRYRDNPGFHRLCPGLRAAQSGQGFAQPGGIFPRRADPFGVESGPEHGGHAVRGRHAPAGDGHHRRLGNFRPVAVVDLRFGLPADGVSAGPWLAAGGRADGRGVFRIALRRPAGGGPAQAGLAPPAAAAFLGLAGLQEHPGICSTAARVGP